MNKKKFRRSIPLLIMLTPIVVYYIIFHYLPMLGIVMSFQDYRIRDGFLGSKWVGLEHFRLIFGSKSLRRVIGNTFRLGITRYCTGFPIPIILALLLNEVRNANYKKTVQTLVYLPHFLSWVAVAGIAFTVFSQENGLINNIIRLFGGKAYPFLNRDGSWLVVYCVMNYWKDAGFGAVVYLAALSGVDASLYEAAAIDGCSRWKQMLYVSLPCIVPTIVLDLILSAGNMATAGFDAVYNLQTSAVQSSTEVISTWVYKTGLQDMQFSRAAAMGLFNGLLSLILVLAANRLARKIDNSLW